MPLSKRPAAKRKQLDNLKAAPAPERANRRAVKHGARAQPDATTLAAIEQEIRDALPIRGPDGDAPIHDLFAVELLALAIARFRSCRAYVAEHGAFFRDGRPRPAAIHERRLSNEVSALLDKLALTPSSRARLGVDLARTRDLAMEMSALDVPDADVVDEPDENGEYDG